MSKVEVVNSLTQEEVHAVTVAKQRAVLANSEAEKAVALSRLADSEAKNLILQIYNKYSLKVGQDQILETGKIVRKVDVDAAKEAAAEEQAKANAKKAAIKKTTKTKNENTEEVAELTSETLTD